MVLYFEKLQFLLVPVNAVSLNVRLGICIHVIVATVSPALTCLTVLQSP